MRTAFVLFMEILLCIFNVWCGLCGKLGDTEIEAFRVIECLKKAGMEIKDIRQFMDWCVEGPSTSPRNRPFPQNAGKLQKMLQFSHEKGRFPIDRLVIIGV